MSTVIAHEIRNPLMILRASVRPLKQPQALSGGDVREIADDIDGEITRINRIVTDVLDFARPISFDLAAADINAICVNAAAASQPLKITYPIHLKLGQNLPPIVTDAERLRMALINVLNNARHAVDARFEGEHAVALSRNTSGPIADVTVEPWVELSTEASAGHVLIVIRDRGIGIDEVDLARVFDPYFTTKPGGTGLGLAIVKNIVEGLGGTIKVVSKPKQGSDVRIELTTTPGFAVATPPLAMTVAEH
jgi:two-component system sensor histidine kinase HydH